MRSGSQPPPSPWPAHCLLQDRHEPRYGVNQQRGPMALPLARLTTGVSGLDDILHGGLIAERLYLVDGNPGSGKTTFALQFLLAGVRKGERCLYVTLSETRDELLEGAESHDWSVHGID